MREKLSLVMMARNAESTILRTLRNVEDYVSEFILVDNMSDDRTVAIAKEWSEEVARKRPGEGFAFRTIPFNPESHPDHFVLDEASVFSSAPFAAKVEYSGLPLLINWSAMRNLTARSATKPFVLMLDADDLFEEPRAIPGLVERMIEHERDVLYTRYQIMQPGIPYPVCELICWRIFAREALSDDYGHWEGWTHEYFTGHRRPAYAPEINVKDMRDNTGSGARVPSRALKILWLQAQKEGIDKVSSRTLYYLGTEAISVDRDFSESMLNLYLKKGFDPQERSSALVAQAEIMEARGDYKGAFAKLERAKKNIETPDVLFTEARIHYRMGREVDRSEGERIHHLGRMIETSVLGFELLNSMRKMIFTRSPVLERGTYIILAEGLASLGRHKEAQEWARKGLVAFPEAEFLRAYSNSETQS
jgi:glycosyltransferase involved in cell wall biosynthesis